MVESDEKLAERVTFIHERIGTAAIAEQYIEGRELYVGVLGNDRRRVLPIWELEFGDLAQGTRRDRHREGQARSSITRSAAASLQGPAEGLPPQLQARINNLVKRICRTLELDGYARIDFRLSRRRHAVFHRGQPQSRNRQERGIRPVGAA